MTMNIIGVIPARYKSVRFEGKPLALIGKKTMIQMVYEQCLQSQLLNTLLVATDDERIYETVLKFGGKAVLTSSDIATGSDRCFAAAKSQVQPHDIVVNIQGDEPLISADVIDASIQALIDAPQAVCSTPVVESTDSDELNSPHAVKVALNQNFEALYFSRYSIPFNRTNHPLRKYWKHIGLYCYRSDFLEKYVAMPQTPLELSESLEQLRILEYGYRIQCCAVHYESHGVDTPEDLEKVKKLLNL
jgi:3-deoxy-manno-octulosonate cytidylyltransferase (CMP-KDO synthetase)